MKAVSQQTLLPSEHTGYYIRSKLSIVHIGQDGTYLSGSSNTFIGYGAGRGGTTSFPFITGTDNVWEKLS